MEYIRTRLEENVWQEAFSIGEKVRKFEDEGQYVEFANAEADYLELKLGFVSFHYQMIVADGFRTGYQTQARKSKGEEHANQEHEEVR